MNIFDGSYLEKYIFYESSRNPGYIGSRESATLEFKETFSFGNLPKYAKTMASFANNSGGYIIFGIGDNPRKILGLKGNQFDSIDTAKLTETLNDIFVPEIEWELTSFVWKDKAFGIIYTRNQLDKPVIAKKNSEDIKEGDIYYRYHGRNERIKYSELSKIINGKLEIERNSWKKIFESATLMGPQNVALLDTLEGKIEGLGQTVIIDEGLLPKLKFIKEGEFSEKTGAVTLKLVGELRTAPVTALKEKKVVIGEDIYRFRATDVCKQVQSAINKEFRVGSEHLRAWKRHKIRPSAKPPIKLPHKNEFCEYKEAERDYRYSQTWIDFLIHHYKKDGEFKILKSIEIHK